MRVGLVTSYMPPHLGGIERIAENLFAGYRDCGVQASRLSNVPPGSWAYYHRNNSPDLDDPVLFVRDLGAERNKALIHFLPNRRPYWMGMTNGRLVLQPIDR
jgi:hypothetical protein